MTVKKPTVLKLMEGTQRPDRTNEAEPDLDVQSPDMPAWLSPKAKTVWKGLTSILVDMRVLTKADKIALEMVCSTYSDWRDAVAFVNKNGQTYETVTPAGDIMHRPYPQVTIASDSYKRLMAGIQQFGLTPATRSNVSAKDVVSTDPVAEFMNGAKKRK